MKKQIISLLIVMVMLLSCLVGCVQVQELTEEDLANMGYVKNPADNGWVKDPANNGWVQDPANNGCHLKALSMLLKWKVRLFIGFPVYRLQA